MTYSQSRHWAENIQHFGENTLSLSARIYFFIFFLYSSVFFQSPADSSCLQSERQNESSRGITSLSTECQKYLLWLAVTLFHSFVFCIIHITMTLLLSGENLISPKFFKGRKEQKIILRLRIKNYSIYPVRD